MFKQDGYELSIPFSRDDAQQGNQKRYLRLPIFLHFAPFWGFRFVSVSAIFMLYAEPIQTEYA